VVKSTFYFPLSTFWNEVSMAEAVQQSIEKGNVTAAAMEFEPEVLAFCCEH